MKRYTYLLLLCPLALLHAGCEVSKSNNPLSPSLAGPIPGVEISAPKLLEPGSGDQIPGDRQPVTLLLENSSTNGPRPLNYVFEVATDAGFGNKVFEREGIQPGEGGRTTLRLPDALITGRNYYWRAKAQDGANTSPYSPAVIFNVFTPLAFDKPTPISPINNTKTSDVAPEFRWGNAPRVGTPVSVAYVVEVAATETFGSVLAGWSVNEHPSGDTKLLSPAGLPVNAQLFWRVRANDGGVLGPWSETASFRTPAPIVVVPVPTPSPAPGGSCATFSTPFQIIDCRRKQYGHMSSSQVIAFLKASASDLNKAGIGGGPFGLLRKGGGANCGGYSCDIICAGQGAAQRQYDVLGDAEGAQTAAWSGPHTYPGIRIDSCEIQ